MEDKVEDKIEVMHGLNGVPVPVKEMLKLVDRFIADTPGIKKTTISILIGREKTYLSQCSMGRISKVEPEVIEDLKRVFREKYRWLHRVVK